MCPKTTRRRTVLTSVLALVLGALAGPVSASGRNEGDSGRCEGLPSGDPANSGDALSRRSDAYIAVVDRIVDGRFVVLLIEEDDRIVEQLVVPAEELAVEEGDVLLVTVDDGEVMESRVLVGETERRMLWSRKRLECLIHR